VVARPNKQIERGIGIAGNAALFFACIRRLLGIIDWIGCVQTTVTLSPHISILLSPPAFIALLILGFSLIYIAGKLEHTREVGFWRRFSEQMDLKGYRFLLIPMDADKMS
jgi:hypothetical protein